jgi:PAS domain S-box-containing protein
VVVFGQNQRLREARDLLRDEARRYRLITEHAGDLVAMVDRDARWMYASPSYARFFRPEDLVAGGDALRNLHEEDQFRVRGALQVVVRSGETCRLRMRLHTFSGEIRSLEAMVHPVREEGGDKGAEPRITAAVMASRDVTELRDREEQLEVAAHAFERMAEGMVITNAAGRISQTSPTRASPATPRRGAGRKASSARRCNRSLTTCTPSAAQRPLDGTTGAAGADGIYREWRSVSACATPKSGHPLRG